MPRFLLCSSVFFGFGCAGIFANLEGDEEGECANDVDEDADGLFDCADSDCAGASVCASDLVAFDETDSDTDSDSDSDTDSDADTDADFDAQTVWSADGVVLDIEGGQGKYSLGMVQTNNEGWRGRIASRARARAATAAITTFATTTCRPPGARC